MTGVAPGEASSREAVGAARTSVLVASALGGMKILAALFTGSLAIASSFVDSLMDVFASSVNLVAVRIGGTPADEEHRYGHGKAESLAGMFQGAVVGFSGVFLVVESVRRLVSGGTVSYPLWGIAVMVVSSVVSVWITWRLRRAAKHTGSVALRADATHYSTDVWMNVGVLASLLAVKATGLHWIDAATGLGISLLVLWSSWSVIRASIDDLMDRDLGSTFEAGVGDAIAREVPEARRITDLPIRRAGPLGSD